MHVYCFKIAAEKREQNCMKNKRLRESRYYIIDAYIVQRISKEIISTMHMYCADNKNN